jgi:hypothetical protein
MDSESGKYGVYREVEGSAPAHKEVGAQEFTTKVQRPDLGYQGRLMRNDPPEHSAGRDILRTRYRSGSFTESHFTPGDDRQHHSSYHYSRRENTVYSIKSNRARATRLTHKRMEHLF